MDKLLEKKEKKRKPNELPQNILRVENFTVEYVFSLVTMNPRSDNTSSVATNYCISHYSHHYPP